MASAGGIAANSANGSPWSSGLCDCFSDIESCCCTIWCPCVPFGQASEIIDEGSTWENTTSKKLHAMIVVFTFGVGVVHCVKSIVSSKTAVSTCILVGKKTCRDEIGEHRSHLQLRDK
ncbi:hypothetical protein IC575_024838 [Cucumis melo]